jgi:hypothetical protein
MTLRQIASSSWRAVDLSQAVASPARRRAIAEPKTKIPGAAGFSAAEI